MTIAHEREQYRKLVNQILGALGAPTERNGDRYVPIKGEPHEHSRYRTLQALRAQAVICASEIEGVDRRRRLTRKV